MESVVYTCKGCGRDLSDLNPEQPDERKPCPDCGSTLRKVFVTIEEQVNCSVSMSAKSKDASGHVKQEIRQRDDVSEKTGKPVKVSVDVDRRNPDETKVTHRVEEVDKITGYTTKIHEDVKIGKAKHRPKSK